MLNFFSLRGRVVKPWAPGPPLFFVFCFQTLALMFQMPRPSTHREIKNTPPKDNDLKVWAAMSKAHRQASRKAFLHPNLTALSKDRSSTSKVTVIMIFSPLLRKRSSLSGAKRLPVTRYHIIPGTMSLDGATTVSAIFLHSSFWCERRGSSRPPAPSSRVLSVNR